MFVGTGGSRCCVHLTSTVQMRVRSPAANRVMETPVRIAPRLTVQDPLAAAGSVVLHCRPQVLPGAMDVSGTDLAEIRSMSRAGVATAVPPEREQSCGGGGLAKFNLSGVGRDSAGRYRD